MTLSYVTISSSAGTVLTDHIQWPPNWLHTVWSVLPQEWPQGVSWKDWVSTQDVTQHTQAGQWCLCSSSCPGVAWRAAQNLPLKTSCQIWSIASQGSQQEFGQALCCISVRWTRLVPCLIYAESGWGVPGHTREWVTKCTGNVHRQIPAITAITARQTSISFSHQT